MNTRVLSLDELVLAESVVRRVVIPKFGDVELHLQIFPLNLSSRLFRQLNLPKDLSAATNRLRELLGDQSEIILHFAGVDTLRLSTRLPPSIRASTGDDPKGLLGVGGTITGTSTQSQSEGPRSPNAKCLLVELMDWELEVCFDSVAIHRTDGTSFA